MQCKILYKLLSYLLIKIYPNAVSTIILRFLSMTINENTSPIHLKVPFKLYEVLIGKGSRKFFFVNF